MKTRHTAYGRYTTRRGTYRLGHSGNILAVARPIRRFHRIYRAEDLYGFLNNRKVHPRRHLGRIHFRHNMAPGSRVVAHARPIKR